MVSPSFAPTWIFIEPSLDSTFTPLNWVWPDTRSISSRRDLISSWMESRSESELVPVVAWTVSSRIRCKLLLISDSAPSVVCATEIPSLALRAAWVRPLILEVKRLAIAWPAASSFALLIRKPEDRRSIELDSADWFLLILFWVISERLLVLMTCAMIRYPILQVVDYVLGFHPSAQSPSTLLSSVVKQPLEFFSQTAIFC